MENEPDGGFRFKEFMTTWTRGLLTGNGVLN